VLPLGYTPRATKKCLRLGIQFLRLAVGEVEESSPPLRLADLLEITQRMVQAQQGGRPPPEETARR
jgi:hypothetical protein